MIKSNLPVNARVCCTVFFVMFQSDGDGISSVESDVGFMLNLFVSSLKDFLSTLLAMPQNV